MQLIIDVDEKLVCEGFERPFTEEEKATLIRAIGNGRTYNPLAWEQGYEVGLVQGHQDGVREVLSGFHQGEWINHRNDYGHNIADCSLCGKTMQWHDEDEDGVPKYCWYCGAPMKGVKND